MAQTNPTVKQEGPKAKPYSNSNQTYDYSIGYETSKVKRIAYGWATNDPIVPSQGYGGHPVAARPKRKALTVYEGRQPFMIEIPMLLWKGITPNSKGQPESVEPFRKELEAMASVQGVDEAQQPPGVFFESPSGIPLPIPPQLGPYQEWWIEDLKWGEERRNSPYIQSKVDPGHLIWKIVTVTLLEKLTDQGSGGHRVGEPQVRTNTAHTYRVKKGDTLRSIAASQLGNGTRWPEIAKLNNIRSDSDLDKFIGKLIKIPASSGHFQQSITTSR